MIVECCGHNQPFYMGHIMSQASQRMDRVSSNCGTHGNCCTEKLNDEDRSLNESINRTSLRVGKD